MGGRSSRDKSDKLTTAPLPHILKPLSQKRKRRLELKLNLGRREGWGKDVLSFVFISHYPSLTFHWQWIKLISPNQVWFACDHTSWTLCHTFSSPSRWEGWVIRVVLVGTLCSAKVIPSQHNLLSPLNFILVSILSLFFFLFCTNELYSGICFMSPNSVTGYSGNSGFSIPCSVLANSQLVIYSLT